ncbi:MAG: endonuclease MutS2, partial [Bacteroidetes bacterium]
LTKTYEQLHRDLEFRRKRLKLEAKEAALQQTVQENKELERLVRELREEKNLEKAKEVSLEIRSLRQNLAEEVTGLREDVYHGPVTAKSTADKPIQVGDHVKMRSGGATGEVVDIDKKYATVLMGEMRMRIKLRDLVAAKTPIDVNAAKSIHSDVDYAARFDNKIDIRGMRYVEAIKVVEEFVDQAILANVTDLRIVHGKGNGALRKAVQQKLREYRLDMEITHPPAEQGGDGVTLVRF